MRTVYKCFLVTYLLGIAANSQAAPEVFMDSQAWQVGYDASDNQQHLTEYVMGGQTVENWQKLLTRQILYDPKGKFSLSRLTDLMRQGFGPDCRNFQWRTLRESSSEIVYSWSHDGCDGFPAQVEFGKIVRVPMALCRWAYATKFVPSPKDTEAVLVGELSELSCE